ncbi:TPA: restriction endonuclease subunit S, partial [Salmonella enterica subsp. diarizonae serovar -:z10:-]
MAVEKLIVDHIDTWTTALQTRSTAGRGSSGKIDLYGIKKLRELILELAVRGKLVPQDPNDEPASELLKRIAAEKAELVKQGKIKKQKPLPEISEEEKPFELPVGWEWARFETALDFSGGSQPPKSFFIEEPKEGYVQLIQIRDLGEYPQPVYVPINKVTKLCTSEDILIGRYGASVGKVFWGKNGAYNVALI